MASSITYIVNLIKKKVLQTEVIDERRSWHQDCDAEIREVMVFCIAQLIRSTDADEEDKLYAQKLNEVSHYIEQYLYFSASYLDDYKDPITLVERISYLCLKLLYDFSVPNEATVVDESNVIKAGTTKVIYSKVKSDSEPSEGKRSASPDIVYSSALFSSEYVRKQYENTRMTLKHSGLTNDDLMPPAASFSAENNGKLPDSSAGLDNPTNSLTSTVFDDNDDTMLRPVSVSDVHDSHGMIPPNVNVAMYPSLGHRPMPHNAKANTISVSSQGCSRVYIIKVLRIIAEFVRGKSLPSIFTFKKELVGGWLSKAKDQCKSQNYVNEELEFGGPPFIENDPSTHWLESNQLYTWWKNNVERRQKFRILQDDSMYSGDDARKKMRARWCQAIVNLSEIIRRSSGSSVAARANMNLHNTIISNLGLKYQPDNIPLLDSCNNLLCNEDFQMSEDEVMQQMHSVTTDIYSTPTERVRLKTKFDEAQLINMRKVLDSTQRRRENYRKKKMGTLDLLTNDHPDISGDGDDIQLRTWTRTFPHKLYDLINASQEEVVCWAEDGKSFSIRNINRFISEVLPTSFKQKSFLSFQRQLNLYGFKRVPHILRGTYFHPYFVKGRIDLIDKVRRLQSHLEAEVSHYKKINKMKNTHQLLTLASNADLIDAVGLIPKAPGDNLPDLAEPRTKRKYTKRTPAGFVDPGEQEVIEVEELEGETTRYNSRYPKKRLRNNEDGDDTEEEDEEEDNDDDNEIEDRRLKSQIGAYNDADFEYYNYKKVSSKSNRSVAAAAVRSRKSESTSKRARANSFAILLDRFYNKLDVDTPADTDLLDLLQPKKNRIFLDFIYDKEEKPANTVDALTKIVEVNSCGPFHGIYMPKLNNTVQSCYNVDMAVIRNISDENTLSRGFSRMSRTNSNYNDPKSSRVGPEYQALCPDVLGNAAGLQSRSKALEHTVECWNSSLFNEWMSAMNIDEFIARMKNYVIGDRYLPIGSVLMVTIPDVSERRNRLVCILDYVDSTTMISANIAEVTGDNLLVRVYDGNQDLYVTYTCIVGGAYGLSYYSNAYDWLHHHNYQTPVSKDDYKRMVDTIFKNLVPCPLSMWSSDEVETLLDGVRRFGDDVKKVYNLLVSNHDNRKSVMRTYSEVLVFYHVIFPHANSIGARKVISLFNRAERAQQGIPDAESDEEEEEEEEEDDEGNYYSQDELAEEESNIDDQEVQITPETKHTKSATSSSKKATKQIKSAVVGAQLEAAQSNKKGRKPYSKGKDSETKEEPAPTTTSSYTGRKRAFNPKYVDGF